MKRSKAGMAEVGGGAHRAPIDGDMWKIIESGYCQRYVGSYCVSMGNAHHFSSQSVVSVQTLALLQ